MLMDKKTTSSGARLFPLAMAAEGERVKICFLRAGKGLEKRLIELGLNLEAEIEIVHRRSNGAVVVARDEMRLALGAGMAHKIMVAPA
jgi:ferrous iron transport protein A